MSDTKFTKGEWLVEPESYRIIANEQVITSANFLMGGRTYGMAVEEMAANAHLIAAAPELYEALEAMEAHISTLLESGDMGFRDEESIEGLLPARKALAKARGEGE